ncbi:hypothetical protein ACDY96_02265 [Rhizobium mongolense]|uniref:hypothetical protein n=1 Tax=Rhizobium mongolense TaxID=57676 RepID=UPI003556D1E8
MKGTYQQTAPCEIIQRLSESWAQVCGVQTGCIRVASNKLQHIEKPGNALLLFDTTNRNIREYVGFAGNHREEPENADELNITFSVLPPFPDSPTEGTRYRFLYGWDRGALRDGGLFTYQSDSLGGDPESGYTMTITARASDFIDADKKADSEALRANDCR